MWNIGAETKALALSPARHIWAKAIFGTKSGNTWVNDRTYCETDKVVSASVDIGTKSGGIQVGNAFCGKLTLRLLEGAEIHQTDRIIIRVGFYKADGTKSEEISLGWYYVDTIKKSGGIYTITAYDKMLRAQKNYNSKLTYPAKMSEVLGEICDSLGMNLASDFAVPYDGTISERPIKGKDSDGNEVYYTRREMLSYLASAMGGNFFFDVGGHLQLTRFAAVNDSFSAANSIEADISEDSYSVNGIVWTLGGVTYSRNDEDTNGIMEFENPLTFYPKEPVQHAIEERVTGLNYHEATIRRQGCGWFELGDKVTAYRADGTSAPVLVTGLNYSIADGGFTEKIYSSARSSSQDNYTTGDITGQSVPQSVGGTAKSSCDGKLHDTAGTAAEAYLTSGHTAVSQITGTSSSGATMFEVGSAGGQLILRGNGGQIVLNGSTNEIIIATGSSPSNFIRMYDPISGGFIVSPANGPKFEVRKTTAGKSTITITPPEGYGKQIVIECGNDGYANTSIWTSGHRLEFDDEKGLLYNGKKVLTED